MRTLLIFLLLPLKLFSQDLEGVWTGTIYNDTTQQYIPYEIAISESKGKISGFSHTVFIDNNKEVTGIKTLKIKRKSEKILIEDDELIYNNYIQPPEKGIKKYCVLNIVKGDSGLLLIGVFNTNRTKEYSSATGTIRLLKKVKISETKIIPKLEELKLANSLSFIQNKQKEDVAIVPANTKNIQPFQPKKEADVAIIFLPTKKESITQGDDDDAPPSLIIIKEDTIEYKADVVKSKEIGIIEKPKKEEVKVVAIKKPPVVQQKKEVASKPVKDEKKSQPIPPPREKTITTAITQANKKTESIPQQKINKAPVNTQVVTKKPDNNSLSKEKDIAITPKLQPIEKSVLTSAPSVSVAELAKRKIETIRTVNFKSDSLVLTLYDNGVVDGDTVSVILNGKNIMPRQGLTTRPINKTIYITPDLGDSLQLIMYAENLGSIPPNTGLLIIHDGEDMYQIRFAGDLQKNSAIILRRKKN